MNVTRLERRILELLARGGRIDVETDEKGKIIECHFVTREGWYLEGGDVLLFKRLKAKRMIASRQSGPYRITRLGVQALQPAQKPSQPTGRKPVRERRHGL